MTEAIQKDLKKRRQKWTLLVVGDRGSVFQVPRIKLVLIVMLSIGGLLVSANFLLIVSSKGLFEESTALRRRAAELRQSNLRLTQEKEILSARLLILDPRGDPAAPTRAATTNDARNDAPAAAADIDTRFSAPLSEESEKSTSSAPGIVSVGDFDFTVTADKMDIRFVVKKASDQPGPVSGRAFVVLFDPDRSDLKPLVVPDASFQSGRPHPTENGRYFSIHNFKNMAFRKKNISDASAYKAAAVIIFDEKGGLVFENLYPLQAGGR